MAESKRLPLGVRDRIALALTAVILTGCGSGGEPSSGVTRLSLDVRSSEWEADRSLMVVGENASVQIGTETDEGCLIEPPCSVSADVELRSSDPDVLSLHPRVRAPANVPVVAHAPGTVTVTATADGLTESRRVDVVTAPLPLDAIRVTLVAAWNDLPVEYDASNSLRSVEVPADDYGALEVVASRSGAIVFGIPISITSSNPLITLGSIDCRAARHDQQCGVHSDAWVFGVTPGDAQITISVRNTSTTFTAHVVGNP